MSMDIMIRTFVVVGAMISVVGCGDDGGKVVVKDGWKWIDAQRYAAMDDVSLPKRWVEIDCNGITKKDVDSKGGVEAMLAKVGGKLEEKGRKCFANLVFLNDALVGMGASHTVVTAVLDKASHAYDLKWKMSVDDVAETLPGVAELYGILTGINAPPADMAEYLVKEYINRPEEKRGDVIESIRQKAEKYRIVKDVLVLSGISSEDAEAALARFVFKHGSGLEKSEFWDNEKKFSQIDCKDLRSLVPDCKKVLNALSAVRECAGKNKAEMLISYISVPAQERGKTLRQMETFAKTFARNRKDMGDFAAALQARELAEGSGCYAAFCEVLTSVGIPEDVVMSELDKSVFRGHDYSALMDVNKDSFRDMKSLKDRCRQMMKTLSSGKVPDERIVRYLAGYLLCPEQDKVRMEKDCPDFVQMYGVVADFVRETVAEAGKARTIFTDGIFDEEIRDESRRVGMSLAPRSMMRSGNRLLESFVDEMTNGTAVAQFGLEHLKHVGAAQSAVYSGVLFRCGKTHDSAAFQKGAVEAERLAERILALQKRNVVDGLMDDEMKKKFLAVQWRIACIARARSECERSSGQVEQAKHSMSIADKLDECNSAVKKVKKALEEARAKAESEMTPRERLKLALARADFEKAQKDAKVILETDPNDLNANFAMGMWHYQGRRWTDAEKHLFKCKAARPDDAAVWNNLAMVYLNMKRYADARVHAQKALALMPGSKDIGDTIKRIEKAIEKGKEGQ